jgi:hypothetical protein
MLLTRCRARWRLAVGNWPSATATLPPPASAPTTSVRRRAGHAGWTPAARGRTPVGRSRGGQVAWRGGRAVGRACGWCVVPSHSTGPATGHPGWGGSQVGKRAPGTASQHGAPRWSNRPHAAGATPSKPCGRRRESAPLGVRSPLDMGSRGGVQPTGSETASGRLRRSGRAAAAPIRKAGAAIPGRRGAPSGRRRRGLASVTCRARCRPAWPSLRRT